MLRSIEKTFDTAFFNANHNLKFINQSLTGLNNSILTEDLFNQLEHSIKNIADQLPVLAFCFAQLMCKTILFSEHCFILKEHFNQLQMENFHFKSDKSFMNFFRKMNRLCPTSMNTNANDENIKFNKLKSSLKTLDTTRNKNSKHKKFDDNKRHHHFEKSIISPKKSQLSNDPSNFETNLIYNLKSKYQGKMKFKHHRYNNVFRLVYKSFKETELINSLRSKNKTYQKEIILLESELTTHRLMVRYLNNQLSGRIQQIQLLTRDKKDSNFQQVWNDLESEISLNKFKTISRALNSTIEHGIWLNLFQTNPLSDLAKSNNQIEQKNILNYVNNNSLTSNEQHQEDLEEDKTPIECKNFRKSWFNIGLFRFVIVDLNDKALGISITGGKEYGLPILISKIHAQTPAHRANAFYPGDIILSVNFTDVTDMTHDEAANLLKNLAGQCRFGVIYFKPDSTIDEHGFNENSMNIKKLSSGVCMNDTEQLCIDYYQSLFNSTLMSPYHFTSDDDSGSSSSEKPHSDSFDNGEKHCHISFYDDDVSENDYIRNRQQQKNMEIKMNNLLMMNRKNTCSFTNDRRALPGMAKLITK